MKKVTLLLISLLLWTFASCSNNSEHQIDNSTNKNNMETFITAQFFVKPEHVADFEALTVDLRSNTRKEDGCIFYLLYQSVEDPTAFIFYEKYKNQAAFDHHLNTEHYKKFAEAIKDLISKEPEVRITI